MSTEPLYVQVAKAIGLRPYRETFTWVYIRAGHDGYEDVPDYDTDWAATGPLLKKYGISLNYDIPLDNWEAATPDGHASTALEPLVAVCQLVAILGKNGTLKAEDE